MLAEKLNTEVWQEVDCLTCANCCKTMTPTFTNKDIRRISAHLNMKPFEFKELLLKIRVLLKRVQLPHMPVGTLLKAADLEMNLDSKEVKRQGKTINLTAKEFQLLEYLLKNKNRVLSRADIAVNVWEVDFDTNTNVIDVYISYVRNKIDKQFSHKLIQTQVGMGYILKEN